MKQKRDKQIFRIAVLCFTLIIAMTVLFSGCVNNSSDEITNTSTEEAVTTPEVKEKIVHTNITDTLAYLASEEMDGRAMGSQGNIDTQQFLIDSMEAFGIEPYGDSYEHPFNYYNNEPIDNVMQFGDKIFTENVDYYVRAMKHIDGQFKMADKDNIEPGCVLLTDDYSTLNSYMYNDDVEAIILRAAEEEIKQSAVFLSYDITLLIKVPADVYDMLYENIGSEIYLKCDYDQKEVQDNNIVGILKGENSENAILVSAHFDHINVDNVDPICGALDNASGVAAVLEIARILSQKESLPVDVIFTFYNGEEIGLKGSEGFNSEVQSDYGNTHLLIINMDCVGEKESNLLRFYSNVTNLSQESAQTITDMMSQNTDIEITLKNMATPGFDHSSFIHYIFVLSDEGYIHTTADTIEKLDPKAIQALSDNLSEFISGFDVTGFD